MYRCGCAEQFGDGSPALKLPTNRPLVYIQDPLPNFSKDQIWGWMKEAHARWTAVCDWIATRIDDMSQAGPNDYVQLVTVADLGTGGVLADQVLPYAGGHILRTRINNRITWKATDGPMQSGTVDPLRTLCHETGHFGGHTHWPTGAPAELMEPVIQQAVTRPQPTEAKVSAGWYGQPAGTPPPPTNPQYDFSRIILDFTSVTGIYVDSGKTLLRLDDPVGLKITDANGKPATVSWPGL